MRLPCTMPAGEGSFKTSYLLSLVRVDGIADTAAKKGPPPYVTHVTPSLRQSRLTVRLCDTDRLVIPVTKSARL